jgi:hypothetical protein
MSDSESPKSDAANRKLPGPLTPEEIEALRRDKKETHERLRELREERKQRESG